MLTTDINRLTEVRKAFPGLDEMTYLNVATHGLTPQPVLDRYLEMLTLTARYGQMRYQSDDIPAYQRARAAVAGILDVPPSWVAFSRNATDGINYVLGSLTWRPDDEVIISNQEHPAVTMPWEYGLRRGLYKGKTVSIDADPAVTLHNLEELITPHTRLIAISHVSSQTGIRVPWPDICALVERLNAAGRERPILTLCDGTQELGQWRVSVPSIGCDFYVSNGHKWLGGPKGSGILVVREQAFGLLTPPYMAGGIDDTGGSGDHMADMINHFNAPRLFEAGTQNLAVASILADAVEWLDNLGWDWVEQRESDMAAYLRAQLRTVPGVTVLTPDAWERSSAITSFSVDGIDARHVHQTLWAQRIIVRLVPELNGIRISTPYFTDEGEIDRLIAALRAIRPA
ncbi:MAG TPA: aminotransferase class V-fold PLP-dependent enzyme [Chloroflexota bacterium]|nr:aminotransferase class V-fold PLP-dependent enzyme [Chloroflexota bacterium]